MKTHKFKPFSLFLVIFLIFPQLSHAYFSTAQNAIQLTETTALFTVSYKFGFDNRELYMPIMAVRATNDTSSQTKAEYSIIADDGEIISIGSTSALVLTNLSTANIVDGQYHLEPGESATFTLVTLLTLPENSSAEEVSLLVTHLPFTTTKNNVPLYQHLNPSELQYYRTPTVKF